MKYWILSCLRGYFEDSLEKGEYDEVKNIVDVLNLYKEWEEEIKTAVIIWFIEDVYDHEKIDKIKGFFSKELGLLFKYLYR